MKLTKSKLKQIIQEELRKVLREEEACSCEPEEMKCPSPGIIPADPENEWYNRIMPWSAVLEGARGDDRFGGEPDPESASMYCDNVNWQQGEFQP
jgi:hypothetical protein